MRQVSVYLSGISSIALMVASAPALAQRGGLDQSQASGAAANLPAKPEAKPQPQAVDEIVVTGLKRDTKLINTPVSITVFDAVKLRNAGITQPRDFLIETSNVNFNTAVNPGDFFVNIRGQSSIRGAEPAVAILIDGAKVGAPAEFNSALFDLDQIEVLKGPQGAYYGRNATAGAIVLTTKKPTEEFSGTAFASYGNDNAYNATMSLSGALVPNMLKARLSLDVNGTDGSYTNVNTGEHPQRFAQKVGRLRLIYDPGGPLTVDVRFTAISGSGGSDYFTSKIGAVPGLSPGGTFVHGYQITNINLNHQLEVPYVSDVTELYKQRIFSGSVKVDYDLGPVVLTSITGAANIDETYGGKNYPYAAASDPLTNYGGWTYIFGDKTQGDRSDITQVTEEVRVTSKGKNFLDYQAGFEFTYDQKRYSLINSLDGSLPASLMDDPAALNGYGGYLLNADGSYTRTLIGGGSLPRTQAGIQGPTSSNPTTSYQDDLYTAYNYAPFANVKINLTDKLGLQIAGRYDIEQRQISSVGPDESNAFAGGVSFNPCVRYTGQTDAQCLAGLSKTFSQFEPKVTLSDAVTSTASVYASYGTSFKSGGFNPIGTRAQTVQGFTQQNIALGFSPEQALARAEQSVIAQDTYKKEVSTTYEAGFKLDLLQRRLFVNGALFWTDIRNGQLYVFDPTVFVQSIQSIDKERVKGFELDANFRLTNALTLFGAYGYIDPTIRALAAQPSAVGKRPPYIALDTLSVGVQLNQPITQVITLTGRLEYNRTGTTYYSIDNNPDFRRDPFGLFNARLGISTSRFDVSLFGRNLFNERYVNEIVPIIAGVATAGSLAELRTYGVEVRIRF